MLLIFKPLKISEFNGGRLRSIFLLIPLALASISYAEEAILKNGKRVPGKLLADGKNKSFLGKNGLVPWDTIHSIRFEELNPRPTVPLTHRLLLDNDQSISGQFLSFQGGEVVFRAFWGELQISRNKSAGIMSPLGEGILALKDFEGDLLQEKTTGLLSGANVFSGKKSLRLSAGTWFQFNQAPPLDPGNVRIYWYDSKKALSGQLILQGAKGDSSLPFDAQGFGSIPPREGWRHLQIEILPGKAFAWMDQILWGELTLPEKGSWHGFKINLTHGELFLDDFLLTEKVSNHPLPSKDPKQDQIWLVSGEQIFGRILAGDQAKAILKTKAGTKEFPWAPMRGFLFSETEKENSPADTFWFQSGPGGNLDRLRGKLEKANDQEITLQHSQLGEIRLPLNQMRRMVLSQQ